MSTDTYVRFFCTRRNKYEGLIFTSFDRKMIIGLELNNRIDCCTSLSFFFRYSSENYSDLYARRVYAKDV